MGMFGASLFDIPFLANDHTLATDTIPSDTFEAYTDGVGLTGLNGGVNGTHLFTINWTSEYVSHVGYMGIQAMDDFEGYTDGANLAGLNGGTEGWASAYV